MASRTFAHRLFRGCLVIRQWMMPESEETPLVGLSKPLTVFHCYIDSVVLAIEKPASGWFRARPVWKCRFRTRVNSFTKTVPSGKEPVFRYSSTFFFSTYT